MAITKTTRLIKLEVYPGDSVMENYEPFIVAHFEDKWDDPEDDELPVIKQRVDKRGRAWEPEHPEIKTPIDDWPTLAQDVAKKIWRY